MEIRKTPRGRANLHIWRTGQSYEHQKGHLYLNDWTNVMFATLPFPDTNQINYYDVRKEFPFNDHSFDAVYALHIVEHLVYKENLSFMREVNRVLKPGGILRISTPDLEDICYQYLKKLDAVTANPSSENILRYDWAMLELMDQIVRQKPGGLMAEAVKKCYFDPEYAKWRYGDVFDEFYQKGNQTKRLNPEIPTKAKFNKNFKDYVYRFYRKILMKIWKGDPRRTIEANRWMFDRVSLKILFEEVGFQGFQIMKFNQSDIPDWKQYNFDQSNYGSYPVEPSLYAEAKKP